MIILTNRRYFLRLLSLITFTMFVILIIHYVTDVSEKALYNKIIQNLKKLEKLDNHKEIIDDLYTNLIKVPSNLPYKLSKPHVENPSHGQAQFVDSYFKNMTHGFFIESGAFDGEQLSNTLFLERFRKWTGLLVEPNPYIFRKLVGKNRKAYIINACLSTKDYPSVETFYPGKGDCFGRIIDNGNYNPQNNTFKVKCYPLISILRALNRFEVDYFSLDVEGAEEGILSKLPWENINIKVISIEHNKWPGGKSNLKHFMKERGYKCVTEIRNVAVAPDLIFAKEAY